MWQSGVAGTLTGLHQQVHCARSVGRTGLRMSCFSSAVSAPGYGAVQCLMKVALLFTHGRRSPSGACSAHTHDSSDLGVWERGGEGSC